LTLFTTPVVYLYLDRLSNAFDNWGRSAPPDQEQQPDQRGSVKQAAE
jgi:HAE1 family hydrophobic/amphiphilic exporter-1